MTLKCPGNFLFGLRARYCSSYRGGEEGYGKLVAGKGKQGIGEGPRKGAGAGVGCGFCAPAKQLYRFHYHDYDPTAPLFLSQHSALCSCWPLTQQKVRGQQAVVWWWFPGTSEGVVHVGPSGTLGAWQNGCGCGSWNPPAV